MSTFQLAIENTNRKILPYLTAPLFLSRKFNFHSLSSTCSALELEFTLFNKLELQSSQRNNKKDATSITMRYAPAVTVVHTFEIPSSMSP